LIYELTGCYALFRLFKEQTFIIAHPEIFVKLVKNGLFLGAEPLSAKEPCALKGPAPDKDRTHPSTYILPHSETSQ
jgi:hypothetical protein